MIARIALLLVTIMAVAPDARPADLVPFSVALAHVERIGVDYADVLATAYVETGGTYRSDLVSSAGACGAMQVMPKWSALSCEQMSEPLGGVLAGVIAWNYWTGRARIHTVAEMYNGGNHPGSRAKAYGIAWSRIRARIVEVEPRKVRGVAAHSLDRVPVRAYHRGTPRTGNPNASLHNCVRPCPRSLR